MIDSASLPPLNTLRVFEAVARHLSFTQAAKELYVTQAAVSHQIKSLEDHLGVKLFSRVKRRVLMTEEAQMLLPSVISAFSSIQDAVEVIREQDAEQTLTVSLTPQFASNWLSFRIGTFYKRHPDINLHLQISSQEPDFVYGKTDDFSYNVVENPIHVHDFQATLLHLMGINHEKLTFKHQGRRYRLTDVHGYVVNDILL